MTDDRNAVIGDLTLAERARTALAAGTWLCWSAADDDCHAPYVDVGGTPVLMVERDVCVQLIDSGYVSTVITLLPALGKVRFGGRLVPVQDDRYAADVLRFREQHVGCADCCGGRRTHLVEVIIDRVELLGETADQVCAVDLEEFRMSAPDQIIAYGARLGPHLNTGHGEQLRRLAAQQLDAPLDSIAAVTVEWIDAAGVDLAVIDGRGSERHRLLFRTPVASADDLGARLHLVLSQADADSR